MHVVHEPIVFVSRIYEDNRAPPADYLGVCTLTLDELRVATIRGLVMHDDFTAEVWRAIVASLPRIGAAELVGLRHQGGRDRMVHVKIPGAAKTIYL